MLGGFPRHVGPNMMADGYRAMTLLSPDVRLLSPRVTMFSEEDEHNYRYNDLILHEEMRD